MLLSAMIIGPFCMHTRGATQSEWRGTTKVINGVPFVHNPKQPISLSLPLYATILSRSARVSILSFPGGNQMAGIQLDRQLFAAHAPGPQINAAPSPDGKMIAYAGGRSDPGDLHLEDQFRGDFFLPFHEIPAVLDVVLVDTMDFKSQEVCRTSNTFWPVRDRPTPFYRFSTQFDISEYRILLFPTQGGAKMSEATSLSLPRAGGRGSWTGTSG